MENEKGKRQYHVPSQPLVCGENNSFKGHFSKGTLQVVVIIRVILSYWRNQTQTYSGQLRCEFCDLIPLFSLHNKFRIFFLVSCIQPVDTVDTMVDST